MKSLIPILNMNVIHSLLSSLAHPWFVLYSSSAFGRADSRVIEVFMGVSEE